MRSRRLWSTCPVTYEATGTVQVRVTTLLSARTMGRISEIRVQPGDTVKAGQVVAILDARDLEAATRQAQAAREEAQNALPEADGAVAASYAQLELAEATFRRMKMLSMRSRSRRRNSMRPRRGSRQPAPAMQ